MLRIVVLGFLLCLVALGGLFARRIYVERQPITGTARFLVGGHKLQIDRAMVRNPELRDGGATNRLDLVLQWPAMQGAAQHMGTTDRNMLVFVGLEDATARARSPDDIDPSVRPVELYARFLDMEADEGPGGLVQRRFRKASPYDGELLYLSTPDERIFSARCPQETAPSGDLCLWQLRLQGVDLLVRFPPAMLAQWQHLNGTVRALVPRFRAASPDK